MKKIIVCLALLGALNACGEDAENPANVSSNPPPKVETPAASSRPAEGDVPGPKDALFNPALATEKAPDRYRVSLETTKGTVNITCVRAWSPHGADRFYNLVKMGYFTNIAFYRAVRGFMVQFGIHGDPAVNAKWMMNRAANIPDDHPEMPQSNQPGYLTFAKASAPNTRSVQLFINTADNGKSGARLDAQGFTPIGKVEGNGLSIINSLFTGYGENTTRLQGEIGTKGDAYLRANFPNLDYIKRATILP